MKHRSIMTKLFALMAVLSGMTFQAAGCDALGGDQLAGQANAGAQTFLNSLFSQWAGTKIKGLLDVD